MLLLKQIRRKTRQELSAYEKIEVTLEGLGSHSRLTLSSLLERAHQSAGMGKPGGTQAGDGRLIEYYNRWRYHEALGDTTLNKFYLAEEIQY